MNGNRRSNYNTPNKNGMILLAKIGIVSRELKQWELKCAAGIRWRNFDHRSRRNFLHSKEQVLPVVRAFETHMPKYRRNGFLRIDAKRQRGNRNAKAQKYRGEEIIHSPMAEFGCQRYNTLMRGLFSR